MRKRTIVKDSNEEITFIKELTAALRNINTSNILDISSLNSAVNAINTFASSIDFIWLKNSKITNIMVHSKSWWDTNCRRDLNTYRAFKSLEDWKQFKKTVKNTKYIFFNLKIQEISNKKQSPWELMNWVNKCKLPSIKTIKYNNRLCHEISNLWHTLHLSFNIA